MGKQTGRMEPGLVLCRIFKAGSFPEVFVAVKVVKVLQKLGLNRESFLNGPFPTYRNCKNYVAPRHFAPWTIISRRPTTTYCSQGPEKRIRPKEQFRIYLSVQHPRHHQTAAAECHKDRSWVRRSHRVSDPDCNCRLWTSREPTAIRRWHATVHCDHEANCRVFHPQSPNLSRRLSGLVRAKRTRTQPW